MSADYSLCVKYYELRSMFKKFHPVNVDAFAMLAYTP